MIALSEHFSLEELSITQVRDVDNTPPADMVENLKVLAAGLEKVRALLGHPLIINSGFRCADVNARVGGVSNSAHLFGWAADFICPAYGAPLAICRALADAPAVPFDQIIEEGTWVHFSVDPRMRGQVLTKNPGGGYSTGLRKAV